MGSETRVFVANQDVLPSVFFYTSYRNYLIDYYNYKKSKNSWASYASIARKIGIAKAHLISIMRGRRNISQSKLESLCQAIQLIGDEKTHFVYLVMFEQAKDATVKSVWAKLIQEHAFVSRDASEALEKNAA